MDDILGAVFALVFIGIPTLSIFAFIFGALNDYGKPRKRRRRTSYAPQKKRYYSYNGRSSEYQYIDNESPGEFLVYFIENPKLNALKIGVGRAGRVNQLLNSHIERSPDSENVGWRVLRIAQFSWSHDDYENGRNKAYEAERRVKFYWKSQGHEPFLKDEQMGYSQVTKKITDETIWIRTQGWSETIEMGKVCEVSTWKYVMSSPGFIMESTEFAQGRDLILLNENHANRTRPPNLKFPSQKGSTAAATDSKVLTAKYDEAAYKESRPYKKRPDSDGTQLGAFKARISENSLTSCRVWQGAKFESGYGLMIWDGKPMPAHRVAWIIELGEELNQSHLLNQCGNRLCVNTNHWSKVDKEIFGCITAFCQNQSRTVFKAGLCERCYQRAKRIRRAVREGSAAKCKSPDCGQMSSSSTSYCVECNAQLRAM